MADRQSEMSQPKEYMPILPNPNITGYSQTPTKQVSALSILNNASDGLALKGVDKFGSSFKICDRVLDVVNPVEVEVLPPVLQEWTAEVKSPIRQYVEAICYSVDTLGFSVESATRNAPRHTGSREAKTDNFYYQAFFTTVPTARITLQQRSIHLTKPLKAELETLEKKVACADETQIQTFCEAIFQKFGSHIYLGDVHFGGVFRHEAEYSSAMQGKDDVEKIVDDALDSFVLTTETDNTEHQSSGVVLRTSKRGGLRSATSFEVWRNGVKTQEKSWAVIDKGSECIALWDALKNQPEGFSPKLIHILKASWEKRELSISESIEKSLGIDEEMDTIKDAVSTVDQNQEQPCKPTSERKQSLLGDLGLRKYYPGKISIENVMQVGRDCLETEGLPEQMALNILRNLIMLDNRAVRNEVEKDNDEDTLKTGLNDLSLNELIQGNFSQTGSETLNEQPNPLDVFLTIFECCDMSLRQVLVEKMYFSHLAVPFIFPGILEDSLTLNSWAMRHIVPVWRDEAQNAVEHSLMNQSIHIVSCLRLGQPKFSKSKLLNNMINTDHETFVDEDCPAGDTEKFTATGLVEASFFLPSGKTTDFLKHLTMFLNLRGDSFEVGKQVHSCSKLADVLLVCVDICELHDPNIIRAMKKIYETSSKVVMVFSNKHAVTEKRMIEELEKYSTIVGDIPFRNTRKIFAFKGKKDKNITMLSKEAKDAIKTLLEGQKGKVLEETISQISNDGIEIDEMNQDCQRGKALSEKVLKEKGRHVSKERLLPLQGHHWQEWCRLLKCKKRSMHANSIQEVGRMEQEMNEHRKKQEGLCSDITPLMKAFIDGLREAIDTPVINFYIQWLKMHFDNVSRKILPPLHKEYYEKLRQYKGKKDHEKGNAEEAGRLQAELKRIEERFQDEVIGFEHLMREMGQVYEAASQSKNRHMKNSVRDLPTLAAKLLLKGYSLEIMDGDASGVPLMWLKAVFDSLELLVGQKKLFCLSVLGIQSSGKSTMLNTMFGLQFPVSAGRCTRGVYMQLVKVKERSDLPFNYVAVLDSEGLRAPEKGESKYDHDNELATFVIGLGNLTMMNIKGENVAEIKDVLQIVSHAFLRMMMVNERIQKDRSCMFIHQNVPALDAHEKMMSGAHKFEEALDQMTVEAASLENLAGVKFFNQVIRFDGQKNVWYVPDLWQGGPPMATVNPGYHDKIQEMKNEIIFEVGKNSKSFMGFSELRTFIHDMWNGVLGDNFVFGFRNSLVTRAYNQLEQKYAELRWQLEVSSMEWVNTIQMEKHNTQEALQNACAKYQRDIGIFIRKTQESVVSELNTFVENDTIMQQWKSEKIVALQYAAESCIRKSQNNIDALRAKQEIRMLTYNEQDYHKQVIISKAKALAAQLKGKDKHILKKEFNVMWEEWISSFVYKDHHGNIPIDERVASVLYDSFPNQFMFLEKQLSKTPLAEKPARHKLEGSIDKNDIGNLEKSISTKVRGFFEGDDKIRNAAVMVLDRSFKKVDSYLAKIQKTACGFDIHHAKEVAAILRKDVKVHNEDSNLQFSIPSELQVKMVVHALRHSMVVFQQMQDYYDKHHSPSAELAVYKKTTWNLFMNLVSQSEKEVIVADILCDQLEGLIKAAVKQKLHLQVVKEVVPKFEATKKNLLRLILEDLAEKGNFKDYKAYIFTPKTYASDWLISFTESYMFDEISGTLWYSSNAEAHLKNLKDGIVQGMRNAIRKVDKQTVQKTTNLLRKFSQEISPFVAFSQSEYKPIMQYEVHDLGNLLALFLKRVETLNADLLCQFKRETRKSIKWNNKSPYEQITDALWGCETGCPFCHEPCKKSDPNHASETDCHECIQHRPKAVTARYWKKNDKLTIENCSYSVQASTAFGCRGLKHECDSQDEPDERKTVYHAYREYKRFLPEWEIPPSADMDLSIYWMWFICKFEEEMMEEFGHEMSEIPQSWRSITMEQAIESLVIYS